MTKVCILTSVHRPFDTRIFQKEAKSLSKEGYNVTLIAPYDKEEIVDGIRIVPLPKPKNRISRMTKTVWMVYCKALEIDADIYHFHDPELILIGLLLKIQQKRVIYDVHEDAPRQNLSKSYLPTLLRKPISKTIEVLEAFSGRRFDAVVTATPFINKRFLNLAANSVNINNYPISKEPCTGNINWEKKKAVVCYVGAFTSARGAFEMVEAIGKTKYRLLFAGNIESDFKESLTQLPGWGRSEALGYLDREGVRSVMAISMAGLVLFHPEPNNIDAQPTKMFEYMLAGLPVIASNFPLWKEIVEGNNCGLTVNPLNTKEITEAIVYILEHFDEAKQMGENGKQAILKKYNWEKEAQKLLALYRNLLK